MRCNNKNSTKLTIILDEPRTTKILRHLAEEWISPGGFFSNIDPPERRLRSKNIIRGSLLHARYLFFAGLLSRSGQQADQAIGSANLIAEKYPELMDPFGDRNNPEFFNVLYYALPFDHNERLERVIHWFDCLRILDQKYQGDPRNIFLSVDLSDLWLAREEVIKRMEEFPGISHKIGQLIGGWFQEVSWKSNREVWRRFRKVPMVPVDIWWLRLIKQIGIVIYCPKDHRDLISRQVSDQVAWFCLKHKIPHMPAAQGMWDCGANKCNTVKNKFNKDGYDYCRYCCPLEQFCSCIVVHNKETQGRGLVNWDNAVKRPAHPYTAICEIPKQASRNGNGKRKKIEESATQHSLSIE